MTTFLGGPLGTLERKELAVVLRALLDRIPVIVSGDSTEGSDLVAEALVNLVPNRREVVFGSDFASESEHEQMMNNEQSNYDEERLIFRAPSCAAPTMTQQIKSFTGWVIAVPEHLLKRIASAIEALTGCAVILTLTNQVVALKANGNQKSLSHTSFEEKLLEKVFSDTEMKIERIARVLKRAAQGRVSERVQSSVVDLRHEEERVRQSLFKEQIEAFVHAAWRMLTILSRLRLLEGVGVNSAISDKILYEAIDYKAAPIQRLLEFISAEWSEDFSKVVGAGRARTFGDRLEGFWTT
jgi:hypothetical protein